MHLFVLFWTAKNHNPQKHRFDFLKSGRNDGNRVVCNETGESRKGPTEMKYVSLFTKIVNVPKIAMWPEIFGKSTEF